MTYQGRLPFLPYEKPILHVEHHTTPQEHFNYHPEVEKPKVVGEENVSIRKRRVVDLYDYMNDSIAMNKEDDALLIALDCSDILKSKPKTIFRVEKVETPFNLIKIQTNHISDKEKNVKEQIEYSTAGEPMNSSSPSHYLIKTGDNILPSSVIKNRDKGNFKPIFKFIRDS